MFLVAGLGNPTKEYSQTRHNAGALALETLVARYGLNPIGTKFHAHAWKGRIGVHDILAIFPQTYMNRSGVAVGEAARFYQIPTQNILVLYDDLDLVTAKFRVKFAGGNGGHNGLKDIDRAVGTEYWRLRLGIDRPTHKAQVTSYVLGAFMEEETRLMDLLYRAIAAHIPSMLDGAADKFMSAVALETKPA
jgi:peptidyl-tRNA hydrolase, PTH1 family